MEQPSGTRTARPNQRADQSSDGIMRSIEDPSSRPQSTAQGSTDLLLPTNSRFYSPPRRVPGQRKEPSKTETTLRRPSPGVNSRAPPAVPKWDINTNPLAQLPPSTVWGGMLGEEGSDGGAFPISRRVSGSIQLTDQQQQYSSQQYGSQQQYARVPEYLRVEAYNDGAFDVSGAGQQQQMQYGSQQQYGGVPEFPRVEADSDGAFDVSGAEQVVVEPIIHPSIHGDAELQNQITAQMQSLHDFYRRLYDQDQQEISGLQLQILAKDARLKKLQAAAKKEAEAVSNGTAIAAITAPGLSSASMDIAAMADNNDKAAVRDALIPSSKQTVSAVSAPNLVSAQQAIPPSSIRAKPVIDVGRGTGGGIGGGVGGDKGTRGDVGRRGGGAGGRGYKPGLFGVQEGTRSDQMDGQPDSSKAGASTYCLMMPPILQRTSDLIRWYARYLNSWRANKTTWLAIMWLVIFTIAVALLIGFLVPWHRGRNKPAEFDELRVAVSYPYGADIKVTMSQKATIYYAAMPRSDVTMSKKAAIYYVVLPKSDVIVPTRRRSLLHMPDPPWELEDIYPIDVIRASDLDGDMHDSFLTPYATACGYREIDEEVSTSFTVATLPVATVRFMKKSHQASPLQTWYVPWLLCLFSICIGNMHNFFLTSFSTACGYREIEDEVSTSFTAANLPLVNNSECQRLRNAVGDDIIGRCFLCPYLDDNVEYTLLIVSQTKYSKSDVSYQEFRTVTQSPPLPPFPPPSPPPGPQIPPYPPPSPPSPPPSPPSPPLPPSPPSPSPPNPPPRPPSPPPPPPTDKPPLLSPGPLPVDGNGESILSLSFALDAVGLVHYAVVLDQVIARSGNLYAYLPSGPPDFSSLLAANFSSKAFTGGVVAAGTIVVNTAWTPYLCRIGSLPGSSDQGGTSTTCNCGPENPCPIPAPCLGSACAAFPSSLNPNSTYSVYYMTQTNDYRLQGTPAPLGIATTQVQAAPPSLPRNTTGGGYRTQIAPEVSPYTFNVNNVQQDRQGFVYLLVSSPFDQESPQVPAGTSTPFQAQPDQPSSLSQRRVRARLSRSLLTATHTQGRQPGPGGGAQSGASHQATLTPLSGRLANLVDAGGMAHRSRGQDSRKILPDKLSEKGSRKSVLKWDGSSTKKTVGAAPPSALSGSRKKLHDTDNSKRIPAKGGSSLAFHESLLEVKQSVASLGSIAGQRKLQQDDAVSNPHVGFTSVLPPQPGSPTFLPTCPLEQECDFDWAIDSTIDPLTEELVYADCININDIEEAGYFNVSSLFSNNLYSSRLVTADIYYNAMVFQAYTKTQDRTPPRFVDYNTTSNSSLIQVSITMNKEGEVYGFLAPFDPDELVNTSSTSTSWPPPSPLSATPYAAGARSQNPLVILPSLTATLRYTITQNISYSIFPMTVSHISYPTHDCLWLSATPYAAGARTQNPLVILPSLTATLRYTITQNISYSVFLMARDKNYNVQEEYTQIVIVVHMETNSPLVWLQLDVIPDSSGTSANVVMLLDSEGVAAIQYQELTNDFVACPAPDQLLSGSLATSGGGSSTMVQTLGRSLTPSVVALTNLQTDTPYVLCVAAANATLGNMQPTTQARTFATPDITPPRISAGLVSDAGSPVSCNE
eukprot:gene2376-8683_t